MEELLNTGHDVTVFDNLSEGHRSAVDQRAVFIHGRLSDEANIAEAIREARAEAVIHFAANALVGESMTDPGKYFRNNVANGVNLLNASVAAGVKKFVFSSTCATYGVPEPSLIPIREGCPQHPINPYGAAKAAAERAIADFHAAQTARGISLACAVLRYFNVIGCDPRGVLGEDHDPETHLVPSALAAALGRRRELVVMGTDYPTPDGTCLRDYVDVTDLCEAHWAALSALTPRAHETFNVGTGIGHSVLEVLAACERVALTRVPSSRGARRPGDPPLLVADSSLIQRRLEWAPRVTSLDDSIASIWRWMRANPLGYA